MTVTLTEDPSADRATRCAALPAAAVAAARTRRAPWTLLLLLLLCVAPVVMSYWTYFVIRPASRTNYASLIEPPRPMPEFFTPPMRDLAGQPAALTALKGRWVLVAVAPAECGAACERLLFMQRQLREMMGAQRDRLDKVWLIDTPGPVAPALLAALRSTPALTLLRVDRAALAQWLHPAPGQALEDHLYVVDPQGSWMMRAPPQPDPMRLKKDLERLLRAAALWDHPGRVR